MPCHDALRGNAALFARLRGPALLERTSPLGDWIQARVEGNAWPYIRAMHTAPSAVAQLEDATGEVFEGINFASQDYLGLATHPDVVAAAVDAARRFGVHSGGSGILSGGSRASLDLEAEIADLVQAEHVLLFPTGWGAGFGAMTGLVRPYDHVLLDEFAHACLQQGANAATGNVHRHSHLDHESLREQLARIRATDPRCGILVATEGLYSMDADIPDLARYLEVVREYGATLLVDQAHDLGASGPGGTGQLGAQQLLGEADLVMGAFSKSFASNGGFIATNSADARAAMAVYGGSFTFSNALSPVQIATVRETLRIVRSAEGDALRARLLEVSRTLRAELAQRGHDCLGSPCAVNPVLIGSEAVARTTTGLLNRRGVLANLAEFPAVGIGAARLRMQAMATHTPDQMRTAARIVADTIDEAHTLVAALPSGKAVPSGAAVTPPRQVRLPEDDAPTGRLVIDLTEAADQRP